MKTAATAAGVVYLDNGAVNVECSTVQIFHRWLVSFYKFSMKKPGHNRTLPDTTGTQNHQTISLFIVRHLSYS